MKRGVFFPAVSTPFTSVKASVYMDSSASIPLPFFSSCCCCIRDALAQLVPERPLHAEMHVPHPQAVEPRSRNPGTVISFNSKVCGSGLV